MHRGRAHPRDVDLSYHPVPDHDIQTRNQEHTRMRRWTHSLALISRVVASTGCYAHMPVAEPRLRVLLRNMGSGKEPNNVDQSTV